MCDSEGDEGSSSHGVWETRVVTGPEVESGALEEGKKEKEKGGKGGGGGRERGCNNESGIREGKTNHHATCVILSRHLTTHM